MKGGEFFEDHFLVRYHTFATLSTFAHDGRIRMHRWSWWNIWKTSRDDRDLTEIFFSQKGRGICVFCAKKVAKGSHWFGKKAGAERIGRVSWISLELKALKWSCQWMHSGIPSFGKAHKWRCVSRNRFTRLVPTTSIFFLLDRFSLVKWLQYHLFEIAWNPCKSKAKYEIWQPINLQQGVKKGHWRISFGGIRLVPKLRGRWKNGRDPSLIISIFVHEPDVKHTSEFSKSYSLVCWHCSYLFFLRSEVCNSNHLIHIPFFRDITGLCVCSPLTKRMDWWQSIGLPMIYPKNGRPNVVWHEESAGRVVRLSLKLRRNMEWLGLTTFWQFMKIFIFAYLFAGFMQLHQVIFLLQEK